MAWAITNSLKGLYQLEMYWATRNLSCTRIPIFFSNQKLPGPTARYWVLPEQTKITIRDVLGAQEWPSIQNTWSYCSVLANCLILDLVIFHCFSGYPVPVFFSTWYITSTTTDSMVLDGILDFQSWVPPYPSVSCWNVFFYLAPYDVNSLTISDIL